MEKIINFTLKVWRQKGPKAKGAFESYQMENISGDTSFLEMLDILNEKLINEGKEPVVFDHGYSKKLNTIWKQTKSFLLSLLNGEWMYFASRLSKALKDLTNAAELSTSAGIWQLRPCSKEFQISGTPA